MKKLLTWFVFFWPVFALSNSKLPKGFVYLQDVDPSIIQEMRYFGEHNFLGTPVPGYLAAKCILTQEAAENLKNVQTELKEYSMTLKVYDCYRPQRAVNSFVAWAKDRYDNKMKKEFYPKVDKAHLFKEGYISEKSAHSRGSTVALTLALLPVAKHPVYKEGQKLVECYLPTAQRFKENSLDFGTGFDCFDPLAHTSNDTLDFQIKKNRLLLKSIMEKNGFRNLPEEWWDFTLNHEPFPNRYFDFVVQ